MKTFQVEFGLRETLLQLMHLVAGGDERLVELRDLIIALCNREVTFGMHLLNRGLQLSLSKRNITFTCTTYSYKVRVLVK